MKPNILLIIIDGLRADKFFGSSKTSHTPNMDTLRKNGVYFNQAISSSDATWICVGGILSSLYPFQSGITRFTNHEKASQIYDVMKKCGYHTFTTTKNTLFFQALTSKLDGRDLFPVDNGFLFSNFGDVGKTMIARLESKNFKEPWFHYIHIMDLHRNVDFPLPEQFKDKKFGDNDYERMLSGIDFWIGKILQKINLENTLVVLTADHGNFLPVKEIGHELTYIPTLVDNARKIKKHTPQSLQPAGLKVFESIRSMLTPLRAKKLSRELSKEDFRTLLSYGTNSMWDLFDEIIRVPLLFVGYGISSPKIIGQQVRHVDIFPTVMEIVGIKQTNRVEGQSLVPLFHNKKVEELPAIIQNMTTNPKQPHNVLGVRIPDYKYYRGVKNVKKHVTLFDLKNDPFEKKNIAESNPEIVVDMEKILQNIISKSTIEEFEPPDGEKLEDIEAELKRLGYI